MEDHSKNIVSHYFILSWVVICLQPKYNTLVLMYNCVCLIKTNTYVSSKHYLYMCYIRNTDNSQSGHFSVREICRVGQFSVR